MKNAATSLLLMILCCACRSDGPSASESVPSESAPSGSGHSGVPSGSTARPSESSPAERTSRSAQRELIFSAQPDWIVESSTSQSRKAQYRLPAQEGDKRDAHLVVYYFGSGAGSLQANLDRWVGQFEQPDGSSSEDRMQISTRRVDGMPVTLMDLAGTYRAETAPGSGERVNEPGFRMLAAIVESGHGPYYCKLVGPQRTVGHWERSFQRFIGSL